MRLTANCARTAGKCRQLDRSHPCLSLLPFQPLRFALGAFQKYPAYPPHETMKLRISTLNVRRLNSEGPKLPILTALLASQDIQLAALQEIGAGAPEMTCGEYTVIRQTQYVGWAVLSRLMSTWRFLTITERITIVIHAPSDTSTIGTYAPPTSDTHTVEEIMAHFETLTRTAEAHRRDHKNVVILGDLNGRVNPAEYNAATRFRVHHGWVETNPPMFPTNATGALITQMASFLQMRIANYCFEPTTPITHTFKGTGAWPPSTIDYILLETKASVQCVNCKTVRTADCLSDHNAVIATVNLSTKRKRSPEQPRQLTPGRVADVTPVELAYEVALNTVRAAQGKGDPKPILPVLHTHSHSEQLVEAMTIKHDYIRCHPESAWRHIETPDQDLHIRELLTKSRHEAMTDFALALSELIKNGKMHLAYRALWPLTRGRRKAKTELSEESKHELLSHFETLLRAEQNAPADLSSLPLHPPTPAPFAPCSEHHKLVYTDGSYLEGVGGWCYFIPDSMEIFCGVVNNETAPGRHISNNLAECVAVMWALANVQGPLHIETDSMYVVLTMAHLLQLQASDFEGIEHPDTWRAISHLTTGRHIITTHVSAHQGIPGNETADVGANCGRLRNTLVLRATIDNPAFWNQEKTKSEAYLQNRLQQSNLVSIPAPTRTPVPPQAANDECPASEEIQGAVGRLTLGTAPGPENLSTDAIRKPECLRVLVNLIQTVWQTGTIPKAWLENHLVLLRKKPGALTVDNVRGISLNQCTLKILMRLILDRNPSVSLLENQYAYRRARSCPQAILAVRHFIDKCQETNTLGIVVAVDLCKAFDSVNRNILDEILRHYGYGPRARHLILELYRNETLSIKWTQTEYSKPIHPGRGVKQGCILSPHIFNMCLDTALRNTQICRPPLHSTAHTSNHVLTSGGILIYADDIIILAPSAMDAQRTLNSLQHTLTPFGLKINAKKTCAMRTAMDLVTNKDSTLAYEQRIQHRNMLPMPEMAGHAENTALRVHMGHPIVLETSRNNVPLWCPLERCPYFTSEKMGREAKKSNTRHPNLLIKHLRERHSITVAWQPLNGAPLRRTEADLHFPLTSAAKTLATHGPNLPITLTLDGQLVNEVREFQYLGSHISRDGSVTTEINYRIKKANGTFYRLGTKLWRNEGLHREHRLRFYRTLVLPVLLYSTEAMALTAGEQARLEAVYLQHLRIITGLRCAAVMTGEGLTFRTPPREAVLVAAKAPHLHDTLRQQRLRLRGQIERGNPSNITTAIVSSGTLQTARRGSHRKQWVEQTDEDMTELGITTELAQHIEHWKKAIKPTPVRRPLPPPAPQEVVEVDL